MSKIEHVKIVNNVPLCNHDAKFRHLLEIYASSITVNDFNDLIDRGWRRDGKRLYKPMNDITCCPGHALRLNVNKFNLSRSHKRVIRIIKDYVFNDKKPQKWENFENANINNQINGSIAKSFSNCIISSKKDKTGLQLNEKKKIIRRQRALKKLEAQNVDIEAYQQARRLKEIQRKKPLITRLSEIFDDSKVPKHRFQIRLLQSESPEFAASYEESFQLYCKYQKSVHNLKNGGPWECTKKSYDDSLIASPFEVDAAKGKMFGTFHQQYLIDDKIVAVGIIDVLPGYVSSHYFYYDPDFSFLNLGTFSSLNEIAFVKQLSKDYPELHYYAMGLYVKSNRKLQYKLNFKPEMLCENSLTWISFSFDKITNLNNNFIFKETDISEESVLCYFNEKDIYYTDLCGIIGSTENLNGQLKNYVKYAGKVVTKMRLSILGKYIGKPI